MLHVFSKLKEVMLSHLKIVSEELWQWCLVLELLGNKAEYEIQLGELCNVCSVEVLTKCVQ